MRKMRTSKMLASEIPASEIPASEIPASGKAAAPQKKSRPLAYLAVIGLLLVVLYLLQRLLMPKYVDGVVEGAFVKEYYDEVKDHDVIFIGDCEVYENFSPKVLWEEYGINSYIRGSAEQYIFQSYYMLEDTLRYEIPEVVVFNIQSLQFSESRSEAYNRMSLEGLRWSGTKVRAIRASMTEEEHFIDYVFPILRYHSRWNELGAEDFKYMFSTPKVTFNGYYMRVDTRPVETLPAVKPLPDYSFGDRAWEYLDKMVALCKEKGVKLLFIKAPSLFPHWYDEWDEQVKLYAMSKGVPYLNFLELTDQIGLDYSTDTYDAGLHMNLSGAEKCARYLGQYLVDSYELKDRRGEEALAERWEEKAAAYNAEIERQKALYGIE